MGEGGLQEHSAVSIQHSAKDTVSVTLSRQAMDLFPHALDARVRHPDIVLGTQYSVLSVSTVLNRGKGQVTSRSGVLKPARSRVIIGENASVEGGLAGAFSIQPKICIGDSFSASNGFVPTRA